MAAWSRMEPRDAVRGAQLERMLGEKVPRYDPNHPLANRVKIETPKSPAQGQKAFLLVTTIAPLILHHNWSLVDIVRCLIISHPHFARKFDINDPAKRSDGRKYVARHLLEPMGLQDLVSPQGRPAGSGNRSPRGFGSAYLTASNLRILPFP